MVKRVATILFCSIFIIEAVMPRVELSELALLPELLHHFEKHREESPEISFLEFIYLHYGDSHHLDLDSKGHKKLPFSKSRHLVASVQLIHNLFVIDIPADLAFLFQIEGVSYSEKRACPISIAIWQPPKI